jgi:hypothetical protein
MRKSTSDRAIVRVLDRLVALCAPFVMPAVKHTPVQAR